MRITYINCKSILYVNDNKLYQNTFLSYNSYLLIFYSWLRFHQIPSRWWLRSHHGKDCSNKMLSINKIVKFSIFSVFLKKLKTEIVKKNFIFFYCCFFSCFFFLLKLPLKLQKLIFLAYVSSLSKKKYSIFHFFSLAYGIRFFYKKNIEVKTSMF